MAALHGFVLKDKIPFSEEYQNTTDSFIYINEYYI